MQQALTCRKRKYVDVVVGHGCSGSFDQKMVVGSSGEEHGI